MYEIDLRYATSYRYEADGALHVTFSNVFIFSGVLRIVFKTRISTNISIFIDGYLAGYVGGPSVYDVDTFYVFTDWGEPEYIYIFDNTTNTIITPAIESISLHAVFYNP